MVPSIRSRPVVSNGGPHLSVAYDLSCFMKVFDLIETWSIVDLDKGQNAGTPRARPSTGQTGRGQNAGTSRARFPLRGGRPSCAWFWT